MSYGTTTLTTIYDRSISSFSETTMKRENGRGSRGLLLDNNIEEESCSNGRQETNPVVPNEAAAASAAMTNERSRTQRRSRRRTLISLSNYSLSSRLSLSLSPSTSRSLSWRHIYCAVFLICWIVSGTLGAPTDRQERQPTVEVLDGYVNYSANGSSSMPSFQEISRNAFLQLKGTPVESRFRLGAAYQLESAEKEIHENHLDHRKVEHHHNVEHLTRHHLKKNRKPLGKMKKIEKDKDGDTVLDGRKHALLQLADPEALQMNQRCDGQKFKQRIRVDGCLTKVVVNRLCHGTCASIFIPRLHSKKLKAAFRSCAACAPSEYDYVDITLDCPGRNPPTATKTIVKVKSCKCKEVRIASL